MILIRAALAAVVTGSLLTVPLADDVSDVRGLHAALAAQEEALPRRGYVGVRMAPVPEDVRKAAGLAEETAC